MPVTIPPFTNVPAPNDPVASAWAQQLTQFAVDQIVAQPDAPSSPNTELWYDTDDAGLSFPNMPRGLVAIAYQSATGQNITVEADVTGCTVTWTADPTRVYRTVARVVLRQSATAAEQYAAITTGANGGLQCGGSSFGQVSANGIATHVLEVTESGGLSGTQTRKLRASTSGAAAQPAASPYQAFIAVYDMGAAGQSGGGVYGTPTPWTNVTFENGWANFGGGFQVVQYRKVGDVVELRGVCTHATGNSVAFTLPVGFRPPAAIEYPVVGDVVIGTPRINPNPNGAIAIVSKGNVWVSGWFSTVAT